MSFTCQFCTETFSSQFYLSRHKNTTKYCVNYRDVLFLCRKCMYYTPGIKNIENHIKTCTCETNISNPFTEFEKQINKINFDKELLAEQINVLEESIKNNTSDDNSNILLELKIEKVKNQIYRNIIEQNLSIKIDDIVKEEPDGIHVYNIKTGEIPIINHPEQTQIRRPEQINKKARPIERPTPVERPTIKKARPVERTVEKPIVAEQQTLLQEEDIITTTQSKKTSYKSVSGLNLIPEKTEEEITVLIQEIDSETSFDISILETAQKNISDHFTSLITNRNYTKSLATVKETRNNLLPYVSLPEYINLLNGHIETLNNILNNKKYTKSKITEIISICLSALDMRLLSYEKYTVANLDTDDIHRFDRCLCRTITFLPEYSVFDKTTFFQNFYNYSSVIFPMKKNIERYLFNKYSFHNVIYVPLEKSQPEDPYSFYFLREINKDRNKIKRCWNLDCRLEDLSNEFIYNIKPYLINLFRKLYHDVFRDNEYREDYNSKSSLTEYDMEQLLQNIFYLNKPKEFCLNFRDIVKTNASHTPTENDKFNLYSDDAIQKRRLNNRKEEECKDVAFDLFDDMTQDKVDKFYRNR